MTMSWRGLVVTAAMLVGCLTLATRATADRCARIRCAQIHRLMQPQQAPPLDGPRTVRAATASLRATDRVIGLTQGRAARAYPLSLLAYHRVVRDRVGGVTVAVAFSPLSESALCMLTDEKLAHSGLVYENDDLLRDAGGSLWSVMLGQAVRGARAGERARRARCEVLTWAAWRQLKPQTTVAWPARPAPGFDYRRDPWAWYRADGGHIVAPQRYVDLRLAAKQVVRGVVVGARARAYALPASGRRVINAELGGEPLLVVLDGRRRLAAAYLRRVDGRTLRLTDAGDGLVDDQTGSRWSVLGEATAGPLAGQRLPLAAGSAALFFAWAALHQGTELSIASAELARQASLDPRRNR
jgi:hypothetical protein